MTVYVMWSMYWTQIMLTDQSGMYMYLDMAAVGIYHNCLSICIQVAIVIHQIHFEMAW